MSPTPAPTRRSNAEHLKDPTSFLGSLVRDLTKLITAVGAIYTGVVSLQEQHAATALEVTAIRHDVHALCRHVAKQEGRDVCADDELAAAKPHASVTPTSIVSK